MAERAFTIFDGPDKGTTFVAGGEPIALGRGDKCEIVLHDDRASRLHARIVPEGDDLFIVDENSSNGTFVNGVLVVKRRLEADDVIRIGNNSIIFGRDAPSREQLAAIAGANMQRKVRTAVFGQPTDVLSSPFAPPVSPTESHIVQILEAVADAARSVAEPCGIHIAVESELESDVAFVDAEKLYSGLADMTAKLLELLTPHVSQGEDLPETTLALRVGLDPSGVGLQIELIWIGPPFPADEIRSLARSGAFRPIRYTTTRHGGTLKILPSDASDILARVCLPIRTDQMPGRTIMEK